MTTESERIDNLLPSELYRDGDVQYIELTVVVRHDNRPEWTMPHGAWIIPRGHRLIIEVGPDAKARVYRETLPRAVTPPS